jgi:hypothetical protein
MPDPSGDPRTVYDPHTQALVGSRGGAEGRFCGLRDSPDRALTGMGDQMGGDPQVAHTRTCVLLIIKSIKQESGKSRDMTEHPFSHI